MESENVQTYENAQKTIWENMTGVIPNSFLEDVAVR